MTRAKRNPLTGIYTPAFSGGAAAFSPDDLANLQEWLDFSDVTTLWTDSARSDQVDADGDVIGYMDDKSGNGNDVLQATTAKKGIYKVNIQNSLAIGRWDGGDDALAGSAISAFDGDFTAFWVSKEIGDIGTPFSSDDTANDKFASYHHIGSPYYLGTYDPSVGDTKLVVADGATSADFYVFALQVDGTSFTGYRNGTLQADSHTISGSVPNTTFLVGAQQDGVLGVFDGDLAEILVYSAALSSADITQVNNYLLAKWGVS